MVSVRPEHWWLRLAGLLAIGLLVVVEVQRAS